MTRSTNIMRGVRQVTPAAAGLDAFARWRVSSPFTVFDSKQLHDAAPLLWDVGPQ